MSHLDNRRILEALAHRLFRGEKLSEEEARFLGIVLGRIANGEDANKVLGVRPKKGQTESAAIARQRLSMILSWIAAQIEPDANGRRKSIEAACAAAVHSIVPAAKLMFPGDDERVYDHEYLMRCWSAPEYRHMRTSKRSFYNEDFPFKT
jgi:3-oxoacyl-(acyl-carrier-protein) synthase